MPKVTRKKHAMDEHEKAMRIANALLNMHGHASAYALLKRNYSGTRILNATTILSCLGKKVLDYHDGPFPRKLKEIHFKHACKMVKKVLSFFRYRCDRTKLMKTMLDEGGFVLTFPWSVIKDDEIQIPPMWKHSIFDNDLIDSDAFYLKTKAGVLSWWREFDVERSEPDSVVRVMVKFCDLFKDDISPLWNLCNVDHSRELVEEVYSECFADGKKEEDLIHMEKWILSLGYDQAVVDDIKGCLW